MSVLRRPIHTLTVRAALRLFPRIGKQAAKSGKLLPLGRRRIAASYRKFVWKKCLRFDGRLPKADMTLINDLDIVVDRLLEELNRNRL